MRSFPPRTALKPPAIEALRRSTDHNPASTRGLHGMQSRLLAAVDAFAMVQSFDAKKFLIVGFDFLVFDRLAPLQSMRDVNSVAVPIVETRRNGIYVARATFAHMRGKNHDCARNRNAWDAPLED